LRHSRLSDDGPCFGGERGKIDEGCLDFPADATFSSTNRIVVEGAIAA